MKYVNETEFETQSQQIEQDVENTLDRVVDDYTHHWKGVLGETIQNSFDAWCSNRFERDVIPEEQPLNIHFEVDLNKREFRTWDNAGGMPKKTFYERFAGLDTPGEEKQSGGAGGSYGRGFHVIAGLGDSTYAETFHDDFRGGLVVSGAKQMEVDAKQEIPNQGTRIEVDSCLSDVLIDLTDWNLVEEYIQERFQPLLERDDVTITYAIEGEEHTVEPVDLSGFDTLFEGEIEFELGGEVRTLEDVVIYDATSLDQDVPFDGIQMLKRNQHLDKPFMRVHEYTPKHVRHLDKMFGFCDASTLCPKYENNAHNQFIQSAPSSTGLRSKLEAIEREHFIGTPTDLDQRDELVDTTINVVNSQWETNPFDAEADAPEDSNITSLGSIGETGGNTDKDSGDDEESAPSNIDEPDGDDETTLVDEIEIDWDGGADSETEEDTSPTLTCSTRHQRVDLDSTAQVWASIENPEGSSYRAFSITAVVNKSGESEGPQDLETFQPTVEPGEGTSGDHQWEIETTVPGTYTVDATLVERDTDEREELDTAEVEFVAGEPDDEEVDDEGDDGGRPISFLENITFVRAEDEPEFRADLNEGDHGMVLVVNSAHPEWKHSVKLDGKRGITNQQLTLIRWANEAIINRMLLDEIENELADQVSDEGEQLSEKMSDFVRETLINQMSEMVATAHEKVES